MPVCGLGCRAPRYNTVNFRQCVAEDRVGFDESVFELAVSIRNAVLSLLPSPNRGT